MTKPFLCSLSTFRAIPVNNLNDELWLRHGSEINLHPMGDVYALAFREDCSAASRDLSTPI